MSQSKIHIFICILSIIIVCGFVCITAEAFSFTFPFTESFAIYEGVNNKLIDSTNTITLHITPALVITPLPLPMPNGNKKIEGGHYGGGSKHTPAPLQQQVKIEPCRGLAPEETWKRINENIMRKCTKTPMCSMEGYFEKYQEDCKNVMTCNDNGDKGLNSEDSDTKFNSCRPDSIITPDVVITFNTARPTELPTLPYSNYQIPTMVAPNNWAPSSGLVSKSGSSSSTISSSDSSGKSWGSGAGTGGSTGGGSSGGGVSGTPTFECPPGATCSYFGPGMSSSAELTSTMESDSDWAAFNKVVTRNTTATRTKGKVMTSPTKKISLNVTGTIVNATIRPSFTLL